MIFVYCVVSGFITLSCVVKELYCSKDVEYFTRGGIPLYIRLAVYMLSNEHISWLGMSPLFRQGRIGRYCRYYSYRVLVIVSAAQGLASLYAGLAANPTSTSNILSCQRDYRYVVVM